MISAEVTLTISSELSAIISALGLTPAEGETEVSQDANLAPPYRRGSNDVRLPAR